ncbi:5-formyltetrahydrofolate cyclo-ligase [Corynebacterium atypicum]|uniref:5-formyltetrahydrofolate cyclo-ligase n=1 Tax=Corynebacterium atypicum TaxID=191610 RepID=UPI00068ABCEA|nr:5-formyltetrahydrofolate cyclo-ligase [Corynebacterium atypicum]
MEDSPHAGQLEAAKAKLRSQLRAARQALGAERRSDLNAALLAHLAAFLRGFDRPPQTVAAYVPVGAEPGGRLLIEVLQGEAERILLPVSRPDGTLLWGEFSGPTSLVPAVFGTLEPPVPHWGTEVLDQCAALIVPAAGISSSGVRIGHGGGYYDRTLAAVRASARHRGVSAPVTVGLVYASEFGVAVPAAPHDARVDVVVTERGACDLRAG